MTIETSSDFSAINRFLTDNFSAPTHWPDWNQLVAETFNTNFTYLTAKKDGELVGICPIHEYSYKKGLKKKSSGQTYYIPFGGWIFSRKTDISPKFFPTKGNSHCQVSTLPLLEEFNASYPKEAFAGRSNVLVDKATLIVDLSPTEEELWSTTVHSKRRNLVRKAGKVNMEVRKSDKLEHFEEFYQVYVEASERNDLDVLSRDFFFQLADGPNIRMDMIMAYKEDKQVANVALISDKNYAIYWLGNSANGAKNEGQGELLQWEAIKQAKALGCKYYDLCYIEPEKLPGIYRFKKGFSTDERPILSLTLKPLLFKIINKIT